MGCIYRNTVVIDALQHKMMKTINFGQNRIKYTKLIYCAKANAHVAKLHFSFITFLNCMCIEQELPFSVAAAPTAVGAIVRDPATAPDKTIVWKRK